MVAQRGQVVPFQRLQGGNKVDGNEVTTRRPSKMTWYKSPLRLSNPDYMALTPVAMAALANITEYIERESGPLVGKKTHIASWIGFTVKWLNEAIDQLTDGGFLVVEEVKQGLCITLASPKQDPSKVRARPKHGTKELPIDAGLGDAPLIESKPNGLQKEKEKENPPLPPQGGEGERGPYDHSQAWPQFAQVWPKKVGLAPGGPGERAYFDNVRDWVTHDLCVERAKQITASEYWRRNNYQYVRKAADWLAEMGWHDLQGLEETSRLSQDQLAILRDM